MSTNERTSEQFIQSNERLFHDLLGVLQTGSHPAVLKTANQLYENILFFLPKDRVDLCTRAIEIFKNDGEYADFAYPFAQHIKQIKDGKLVADIAIAMKKDERTPYSMVAAEFERAFITDPDNVEYAADAGKYYYKAGDHDGAIRMLHIATHDHRLGTNTHRFAAGRLHDVHRELGNLEAAEEAITRCVVLTGRKPASP